MTSLFNLVQNTRPSSLSGTPRMIMMVLAYQCMDDETCTVWMYGETLAQRCGIENRQNIYPHLTKLEDTGWLKRTEAKRKRATLFILNKEKLVKESTVPEPEPKYTPQENKVAQALQERGVSKKVADSLSQKFSEDQIHPHLTRKTPGLIVSSIRNQWKEPNERLYTYTEMLQYCQQRGITGNALTTTFNQVPQPSGKPLWKLATNNST